MGVPRRAPMSTPAWKCLPQKEPRVPKPELIGPLTGHRARSAASVFVRLCDVLPRTRCAEPIPEMTRGLAPDSPVAMKPLTTRSATEIASHAERSFGLRGLADDQRASGTPPRSDITVPTQRSGSAYAQWLCQQACVSRVSVEASEKKDERRRLGVALLRMESRHSYVHRVVSPERCGDGDARRPHRHEALLEIDLENPLARTRVLMRTAAAPAITSGFESSGASSTGLPAGSSVPRPRPPPPRRNGAASPAAPRRSR